MNKHIITIIRVIVPIIISCFVLGCTNVRYLKPQKFEVLPELMKSFKTDGRIKVLVPQNAESKYRLEFLTYKIVDSKEVVEINSEDQVVKNFIYVNLNDMNKNAKELIEEVLVKKNIQLSNDAKKYIKFTATKIQWHMRADMTIGANLEFDIETGDGYKMHYMVRDKSPLDVERAVGATSSRAVEKIFQDDKIIKYIEAN